MGWVVLSTLQPAHFQGMRRGWSSLESHDVFGGSDISGSLGPAPQNLMPLAIASTQHRPDPKHAPVFRISLASFRKVCECLLLLTLVREEIPTRIYVQ